MNNDRLMSEAPEMYKIIKDLVTWADGVRERAGSDISPETYVPAFRAAVGFLRRMEGEQ